MHVLVATDGHLDAGAAATYADALAGEGGKVTVLTVVEVPRRLLSELRRIYGEMPESRVDRDAEYVGLQPRGGASPVDWPGDDAMLQRFLDDQRDLRTAELAKELAARRIQYELVVVESEEVARAIVDHATQLAVDAIVIGSHGGGLFEGLLGSTGTKVTRLATCPVLVLRQE